MSGGKKGAINRLRKELQNFMKDPPPYLSVSLPVALPFAAASPHATHALSSSLVLTPSGNRLR
jgi:hypothetical protein